MSSHEICSFFNKFKSVRRSIEKRSFNKMRYPSMSRIEDSPVQWSATDPIRKFFGRSANWRNWPWWSRVLDQTKVSGNPGCFGPRATLLGRVTLTYFLKVAQVPRVIDRPIPRVLRIDSGYQRRRVTENLMNTNWRAGFRIKYGMVINEAAFRRTVRRDPTVRGR